MAQITSKKAGMAYHKIVNAHIKPLKDLETWVTMDDFEVKGYESHPAIQYPFSV